MHTKNPETLDFRPFLLTVSFLLGEKEEQKFSEGTNVSPQRLRHSAARGCREASFYFARESQTWSPEAVRLCGMTAIPIDHRFENHKNGYKSAWVVRKYGLRLMPELYEHLNPMPFEAAVQMELELAEDLRAAGYTVTGGTLTMTDSRLDNEPFKLTECCAG
jgi:hypothetical protein